MADDTPGFSSRKARAGAAVYKDGGEAACAVVLRSRCESPLIITAPCGKIRTKGRSRLSIEPVQLVFGQECMGTGRKATPLLKRRPSSPLEDVATHLVDRCVKRRQVVEPVATTARAGFLEYVWDQSMQPGVVDKGCGGVMHPAILRTPVSARKHKASKQMRVRECQESRQKLRRQLLKQLSVDVEEKSYRAWLNFVLPLATAGKVLDVAKLRAGMAAAEWSVDVVHAPVKSVKTTSISQRKLSTGKMCRGKAHSAAHQIHLQAVCGVFELRQRLRAASLDVSQREGIISTMLQMSKHVDEGRLKMKQGCILVTDIALRRRALKVLLAYNPAWLSLGLCVTLGHHGDAMVGEEDVYTEVFLERHFLGDVGLAKTYATNKAIEGLYRDGYYDCLGRTIFKRFLLLVLFLDRIKVHTALKIADGIDGLDGGSPPLFRHDGSVKSSRQALNDFFSEALHGEGDFLGHLATLGYHVFHVQDPLVECKFRISNLVDDLRDGILLSRLVHVLSCDSTLLKKLHVPCNSSSKRLVNCKIAMQGLEEAGVPLEDDHGSVITVEHVLGGERDQVLVLLWNVMRHLQMPLILSRHRLWEEILRIEILQGSLEAHNFITGLPSILNLLLRWVQVICSMYGQKVLDFKTSFSDGRALCCLVSFYLPTKLPVHEILGATAQDQPSEFQAENVGSASSRNVAARNFSLLRAVGCKFKNIPPELFLDDLLEGCASSSERGIIIYVTFLCSELLRYDSVLHVEKQDGTAATWAAKSIILRHDSHSLDFDKQLDVFNRDGESYPAAQSQLSERVTAAIKIQTWYRATKQRHATRAQVVLVQSKLRDWVEMPGHKRIQSAEENSGSIETVNQALLLQHEMKVVAIQSLVRGWLVRKKLKAAIFQVQKIQCTWRARRARAEFLAMQSAALLIQWRWKKVRNRKRKIEVACAVRIQVWWRGVVARALTKRYRAAATVISKNYRAYTQKKLYGTWKRSLVKFQALSRCKVWRRRFVASKEAAVTIQRFFRHWLYQREKAFNARQNEAALCIQRAWKTYRCRRITRIQASVKIQNAYRSWRQVKMYRKLRVCIISLQALQKCKIVRQRYLKCREAAQKIQNAVHRWILRKEDTMRIRDACARKIQAGWKRYLYKKVIFLAVLKIQRAFRARKCRNGVPIATLLQEDVRELAIIQKYCCNSASIVMRQNIQRCAATKIQACWRRYLLRKSYCAPSMKENGSSKAAVIQIERKTLEVCRATIQMRGERKWFTSIGRAVLCIQRWWRGCYAVRMKAAVTIQRHIRGRQARVSFKELRQSVILLQAHWKGYQHRKGGTALKLHLLELRRRMKVTAANVENSMRLGNRLMEALATLLSRKTVSKILNTCQIIDYATHHSQFCCERLVEGGAVVKLLQLIQTTNRSPPHELVLRHALSILGNLARFPFLATRVAEHEDFMNVITDQLHMFRNKEDVFRSAWKVFQLVCTVPVGVDLLQRSPSVFRRLHVVARNLEKKIEVERRHQDRLPSTAPSPVRNAAERRVKDAVVDYQALVALIKNVMESSERRKAEVQGANTTTLVSHEKGKASEPYFTGQIPTKLICTRPKQGRPPLKDRSNL